MNLVVLATRNPGKVRELAAALSARGVEVVGLDALPDSEAFDVDETAVTFEGNACLKAEAWSARTEFSVIADDSGIEVDALGGEPGVRSARWGGKGLDDAGRNRALVAALRGLSHEQRSGRFVCVLAVARHGRTIGTFRGVVEGRILDEPRGAGGFGYDPLFFYPPLDRAFGELSREEKLTVSHRGQAIAALLEAVEAGELAF